MLPQLEVTQTRLRQELAHLGLAVEQSAELVIKKGKVVGYIIACSWEKKPVDVAHLLALIARHGGYGAIKQTGDKFTLEVSCTL